MNQTARTIRIGIVGLGYAGQGIHGASIREIGSPYQIVAVCDIDADRCAPVAQQWGARQLKSLTDVAGDDEVDLVVIATAPYDRHVDEATEALAAHKHVVIEKPVALTLADAQRLAEAAQGAAGRLFPHQNGRWNLAYQTFCEAIESGVVGDLIFLELRKHMPATPGDAFFNFGSHWIDMLVNLTRGRQLCEITAAVQQPDGWPVHIGYFDATIRYDDGLLARICFLPDSGSPDVQYWYAAGAKGGYRQNWFDIPSDLFRKQVRQTTTDEGPPFVPARFALMDRGDADTIRSDTTAVGFYRHVADVLLNDAAQAITIADIVEQLRIMEAILESARRGRTVTVES